MKQLKPVLCLFVFGALSLHAAPVLDIDFISSEGFSDGVTLDNAPSMNSQGNWVAGDTAGIGYATCNASWERARAYADFTLGIGDSVIIETTLRLTDADSTYADIDAYEIGFAEISIHTGSSTPSIASTLHTLSDGSYWFGGDSVDNRISIPAADNGDWIKFTQTITRSATANEFTGSVSATNLTDGVDLGSTTSSWTESTADGSWGGNMRPSFRNLGFTAGTLLEIDRWTVSTGTNVPPSGIFPLTDPLNSGSWIPYDPMTDEFEGTSLDPQKWEPLSWDGRKPVYHEYNNVSLSNGHAVLSTTWKDGPVGSVSESAYSISSGYFQSTTSRRYGYFEIRCRALDFPIMTTWWLTGGSGSYNREIDMLECPSGVAGYKNYYSCNFHIWKTPTPAGVDDNGGSSIADPEHYWLPFDMVDDFHVYGFEWDKDFCKIYIDGQLYRTRATGSFKVGQRLMVGNEYNSWLNSIAEINSNLGKIGATYDIDYVRTWTKPETDTTWYVDEVNGNDSNSGLSWSQAKKSIPAALNETYDGDSIWVAQGYYPEYLTFFGMHNLEVYGGFVNGDTSLEDRDPQANPTNIQSPPDGYSTVNIKGTQGFRFDGFTVMGTTASYDHGIDILGVCSNVVIANCRIIGHNPANGGGSGAYVDGVDNQGLAYVRFENCEFSGNKSYGQYAGGAAFGARDGAVVDIIDSQIINNDTSGDGGAMTMQWDTESTIVRMTNCLIAANTNNTGRGVIRHNCGTLELINCTVMNNSSDGIESDSWGSPSTTIENTILVGNGAESFWANHSGFSLQDNLFFNNPGGHVNYNGDKNTTSAINALAQASGNVVADPETVVPVTADSDNDQIPDWWELTYGTLVPGNDYDVDYDGDGIGSGAEFVAGTHPKQAGSYLSVAGMVTNGNQHAVLFESQLNRMYSLEVSDDLLSGWTTLTNGISGHGGQVIILDSNGISNRFYRIRVGIE